MACPTEENSGFVDIVGPLQEVTLSKIVATKSPLQLTFSPRTTPPSLQGNQIDDLTGHTCIIYNKTYSIVSIQITPSIHTGYLLPGQVSNGVGELILTFSPKGLGNMETSSYQGLLVCFPIYITNETKNGAYLEQLLSSSDQIRPDSIAKLDTIFSSSREMQSSLAYSTCFETVDGRQQLYSNSLYVHVFPRGIEIKASSWELLKQRMGASFTSYKVPTVIRGSLNGQFKGTLSTYTIENGVKKIQSVSSDGALYKMTLTSSSSEFTNRFEYFKSSPMSNTVITKQYKTSQYKCVPFDQMRDLKTPNDLKNSYVIPGGKDLGTVLEDKKSISNKQKEGDGKSDTLTTAQIEAIIGGTIGAIVVGILAVYFSTRLSSNRS